MLTDDDAPLEQPLPEMSRRKADPFGYHTAMSAADSGRDVERIFMEWARPATPREVQVWQQKSQVSGMWDRIAADLTRLEREWLVQRFISPASKVDAALVLEAYRAGYEQGRRGGPR